MLQYRRLDAPTAEELLHASQLLGWPLLSAIFDKLVHNTIRPDPYRREPLVKQIAAGFEALMMLLGETLPARLAHQCFNTAHYSRVWCVGDFHLLIDSASPCRVV